MTASTLPPPRSTPGPAWFALPPSRTGRLSNGLRVLLVRRSGVPLVEARLWVPWPAGTMGDPAAQDLLAHVLLTHPGCPGSCPLDAVRSAGAAMVASADPDRLGLAGCAPSARTGLLLAAFAHAVTGLDVSALGWQRDQLAEIVARDDANAAVLARTEVLAALYGPDHPYARERPAPERVRALDGEALRRLHAVAARPDRAVLVLVGDVDLDEAMGELDGLLGVAAWPPGEESGAPGDRPVTPLGDGPVAREPRWIPGPSTQAALRLAAVVGGHDDPRFPALDVTNRVLGGYVSSRLFRRLRTERGLVYGTQSWLEHGRLGSRLLVEADCDGPAASQVLDEIRDVLTGLAEQPPADPEVRSAVGFAVGSLCVQVSSQAGLADLLLQVAPRGRGVEWLHEHARAVAAVTGEQVAQVARELVHPERFAVAAVGPGQAAPERSG